MSRCPDAIAGTTGAAPAIKEEEEKEEEEKEEEEEEEAAAAIQVTRAELSSASVSFADAADAGKEDGPVETS